MMSLRQEMMKQQSQQQQLIDLMNRQCNLQLEKKNEEIEIQKQMIESLKTNQESSQKKVKCPKWNRSENFKYYLERLKYWNKIEKHKGKYLELLESLQESGRNNEKEKIELEVGRYDQILKLQRFRTNGMGLEKRQKGEGPTEI